jgi:hypothetical protein
LRSSRLTLLAPLLVPLAVLAAAPRARAGAWTREPGSLFFKLGYERWYTSARYDSTGARVSYLPPAEGSIEKAQYRSQVARLYVEYGLMEGLTAAASGGWANIEAEGLDRFSHSNGATDVTLELRRRLLRAPLVVSLGGETKIPTGYEPSRFPALGSGRADIGARLDAGLSNARIYVTADAGYRVRGGAQANEVPLGIEAGVTAAKDLMVRGALRGAITSGHASGGARFDPALSDSRYVSATASLVLRGRPFDAVFDVDRVLSGRNTLAGTRLGFSLWFAN